ncbi:hypothetical protein IWQ56_003661, partial [Coemansia nantahalensis]
MQVTIKSSDGSKHQVDVEEADTVLMLKTRVSELLDNTPVASLRLIYAGRILKDADALSVYKIADGNTIHLVKSGPKKPAAAPAASAAGAISDGPPQEPTTQQPQQQPSATGGAGGMPDMASLLSSMGGMGAMGGMGGMGGTGGMGGMSGMDFMPQMTPEMLEQMYSNPMVQQMMQQVSSNPELMRSMVESNPALQQRLTPQMREMLADPGFMRMVTNPDIMRATAQLQAA